MNALSVHDGALLVGGGFDRAGEVPLQGLARWDGAGWSRLGSRSYLWDDGYVMDFAEYGGKLAVVGCFSLLNGFQSIVYWNGRHWERPSAPAPAGAYAAASYGGRLFVGGGFGYQTDVRFNNIASWNGSSWQPVGPGAGLETLPIVHPLGYGISIVDDRDPVVHAFAEYQGELIAAGEFDWAGQERILNIGRWDGTAWKALGTGIEGRPAYSSFLTQAMTVFAGELIVGGSFTRAGGVPVNNVAAWDGTRWRALGEGIAGNVQGLAVYAGDLIAVGAFHRVGGREGHGIARWDGERWTAVGFGLFDPPSHVVVHAGMLVVAGNISWTGREKVQSVVRWTGQRWQSLGQEPGPQGWVTSLLEFDGGLLAILQTGELYFWDGSSWTRRGSIPFSPFAATVHNGTLFAAGVHSVNNVSFADLARLQGTIWQPLGSGVDYHALAPYGRGGSLYVGGTFTRAGPYSSVAIARWDGTPVAVAEPIEDPGQVTSSRPLRTTLAVAGPFRDGTVRVEYALASDRLPLRLAIYDVRGRLVRVLDRATRDGGRYERTWDRADERGIAVARGAYFVRLAAGRETLTRKLVVW